MSLKNLNQIGIDSKNSYLKYNKEEVKLSKEFKELFSEVIQKDSKEDVSFSSYTTIVKTPKELTITFPNQWFYIASFFIEYLNSLKEYKEHFHRIFDNVNKDSLAEIKKSNHIPIELKDKIRASFDSDEDIENFSKFLSDYDWWFGSKTIDRGDYFVSPILKLSEVVNVTQSYIAQLAYLLSENPNLLEFLNQSEISKDKPKNIYETDEIKTLNLKKTFANWIIKKDGKSNNYFSNYFSSDYGKLIENLEHYESLYIEDYSSDLFETDSNKIPEKLKEIEKNIYKNEGVFFDHSKKTSNHLPRAIFGRENYLTFIKELISLQNKSTTISKRVNGSNKVYFGAPGTGKSYQITKDLKDIDEVFQKRIIFHPEYDNSSFIGGYKPITGNDGKIKYEFVPQTFTNIYVEACNDSENQYYLIIEEINRGNCAEIFGELFQLLDRDPNYSITPSNELISFLDNNIYNNTFYKKGKMLLPDNLSIIATMNTSDQSLFPMDSAFKRRWDWEYIPIDYEKSDANPSSSFQVDISETEFFPWLDFIEKVNTVIKENPNLGMDKCIGNYFIKAKNNRINLEMFINKAVFYLWNDVFKDENDHIFEENTFYEDFFPIKSNGRDKVLKMLEKVGLEPSKKED